MPRLTDPHLLQIAALYADIETIAILTNTNHFHLKYDSSYALGDFMSRLRERSDATEKLVAAFDGLIDVIKQGPASAGHSGRQGAEGLMESGLVPLDGSDSDDEIFENAMESLYLGREFVEKSGRPTICRFKSRTF